LLAACALYLLLPACGGGGNVHPSPAFVPDVRGTPSKAPSPAAVTATPTTAPPASSSSARIPSTVGRIGLLQVFDYHNGYMSSSTIQRNGRRYDAVWASLSPRAWAAAHPRMIVSNYFIMGLDQYSVTGHHLSWWQGNHPDWILYACTASGAPTHDIAYMTGVNVPDMPLDIHNPQAVAYQVNTMATYAKAAGYNALAVDQVVFFNIYHGGNPAFGQTRKSGEYGCGSWHGATFQRRYKAGADPAYIADVVAYVRQARSILHSRGMTLVVNHVAGSLEDRNERELLANTDAVLNETGFSDYGRYASRPSLTNVTLTWSRYAQSQGVAVLTVDKFINYSAGITGQPLEFSIATYLLANQGAELLFVGGLHGYGTLQYHSEYDAPVGKPCADVSGGPAVFWRRFSGGIAVVNSSTSSATFTLPNGKSYKDLETHASISGTLRAAPMSGYVLLTSSNGCS
jgi:hypothetical protein